MHWSLYVIIGNLICWFALTIILICLFNVKRKGLLFNLGIYKDISKTESTDVAPAPFYHKQRIFRLWYWTINTFDKALLITSLEFSTITAYLILDPTLSTVGNEIASSSPQAVICLVISTLTSTLKMALRLDKVAKPYVDAARIMENAILEYEYCEGTVDVNQRLSKLVEANAHAEKIISIYVE